MQRYFVKERKNDTLILEDSDVHHIKNVMRNQVGDFIECIYQEKLYICQILDSNSNAVFIVEEKDDDNELKWDVTIAVALVKEQKMDLILQKLTELGVTRIIPVRMERCVVQLDESKFAKKKVRWEKICKEAAEQSKRNFIPEIMNIHTIRQLSDFRADKRFVCSTRLSDNFVNNYLQGQDECATMMFVIGPEGGISPREEDILVQAGYIPISFGNRIMRVETAAIYIASVINFCSWR
jgi:16S rRNA (uracil1498-N3)-methyltransferase